MKVIVQDKDLKVEIPKNLFQKISTLFQHQGFIKYLKNTAWLMLDKTLRLFLGLFVGVWVARYLGPDQYGILNFAMSFVGLFSVFANLGLDDILVRELVKSPEKRDELLGTSFTLKLFGSFLVLLFTYIALQFTSTTSLEKVIVMIIAFGQIFVSFSVFDLFFISQVKGKYSGLSGTYSLIISSITRVILILIKAPLIWFAIVVVAEQIIRSIFFIYFYTKQKLKFTSLKFKKSTAYLLLKDSWPLILSGIAIMIYMRIDQVMLKQMLGNKAVGIYAVAVNLSEAWYFIPVLITSSLFPAIINAKKQSEELYYARLQKLYDLMVWMAIAIALPVTFLSNWVVNILYGSAYNQAGKVLMIHIWTGVFVSLGVASGKWFIAENLQNLAFWRTFYGMLINVILNFALIPNYGVQGAAVATLCSQLIASYVSDFFNKKTKKMFWMKTKSILLSGIVKKEGKLMFNLIY